MPIGISDHRRRGDDAAHGYGFADERARRCIECVLVIVTITEVDRVVRHRRRRFDLFGKAGDLDGLVLPYEGARCRVEGIHVAGLVADIHERYPECGIEDD